MSKEMLAYLKSKKETLIKLRDKEVRKCCKKDLFYFYQGKIEMIDEILHVWGDDHSEEMNVVHDFNDYIRCGDVYGKNR